MFSFSILAYLFHALNEASFIRGEIFFLSLVFEGSREYSKKI